MEKLNNFSQKKNKCLEKPDNSCDLNGQTKPPKPFCFVCLAISTGVPLQNLSLNLSQKKDFGFITDTAINLTLNKINDKNEPRHQLLYVTDFLPDP